MESSLIDSTEIIGHAESTSAVGSYEIVRRDESSSYWELIDASDAIDSDIEFDLSSFHAGLASLIPSASWSSSSSDPDSPVYFPDSPVYYWPDSPVSMRDWEIDEIIDLEFFHVDDDDPDEEWMPWTASRKVERPRTRKLGKRVSEKMRNSKKKKPYSYVKAVKLKPGFVRENYWKVTLNFDFQNPI